MEGAWIGFGVLCIIVFGIILYLLYVLNNDNGSSENYRAVMVNDVATDGKFEDSNDSNDSEDSNEMCIYNYFPRHHIKLLILREEGNIELCQVPPKSKKCLSKKEKDKYIIYGQQIQVFIKTYNPEQAIDSNMVTSCMGYPDWTSFQTFTVENPRIRAIRIGQITTRIVGNELEQGVLGGSSMRTLTFHNHTDLPLYLNEDIFVAPHDHLRYRGKWAYGVPMGIVLIDRTGVFPEFQVFRVSTDIYYGLVTDLEQPMFGGFQTVFNDSAIDTLDYNYLNGWVW